MLRANYKLKTCFVKLERDNIKPNLALHNFFIIYKKSISFKRNYDTKLVDNWQLATAKVQVARNWYQWAIIDELHSQ